MLDLPHLIVPHGESTAPLLYIVAVSVHADEPGPSNHLQEPWCRGDQNINTTMTPQPGLDGDVMDHASHGGGALKARAEDDGEVFDYTELCQPD